MKSSAAALDRALGAMLGLAIGDALGATLEFQVRDRYPRVDDLVGGGVFNLPAGCWTDDTSMALCLADSLVARRRFEPGDIMRRFVRWWRDGENSPTGVCFDIGTSTQNALSRFSRNGDPVAGSTSREAAGNGSLMRLAPVVLFSWRDREGARDLARRQSKLTHGAAEAVEACALFSDLLVDAFEGRAKDDVLRPRTWTGEPAITDIASCKWRGKQRRDISSSGYVVHTLEAALWCLDRHDDFRGAVLEAANLGDDADTVAAVTGQLAGALHGKSGIPQSWIEKLMWRDRLSARAEKLYALSTRKA